MKKITIPTQNEIANMTISSTDYALDYVPDALYQGVMERAHLHDDGQPSGHYQYGYLWLRELGNNNQEVKTFDLTTGYTLSRRPNQRNVGVAPRFQDALASGFGTVEVGGQDVLTINGEVTLYPQHEVDQAQAQALSMAACRKSGDQAVLRGAFSRPGRYINEMEVLDNSLIPCYQYQDLYYVRMTDQHAEDHWYRCDPVRVRKSQDGSLQCRDVLFNAQLDANAPVDHGLGEIDMQSTALSRFLNQNFLDDLILSAAMQAQKFTELRVMFNPNVLKNLQQNKSRA